MKIEKKFDCVKSVRDIRNKMYEENKDKSLEEFIDYINRSSKKSSLWKQFWKETETINFKDS